MQAQPKAYFVPFGVQNPADKLTIIFNIETTAISDIIDDKPNDQPAVYYNLNGQRVTHPDKGIYIVNGKKVIIK